MTSYRSTCEIAELAARVMPVAGLVAVQRHGEAVRFARCGDTVGVLTAVDEAIERWRASGRRTLGIIAKSDFLAARYAELIARDRNLLYVAVTRAMHALTVLYRDEPSPLLGEERPR
ncbi:hypothetical protein [uncultured Adlercreutzia sp.]|uniref:hypothetical protein n=1 Tax=uncultured Adlercreutzia sp. TaxID=875803 RepID=UPI002665FF8B|nr:hypothetical protein [uncultured Adlercreutzia sp.]